MRKEFKVYKVPVPEHGQEERIQLVDEEGQVYDLYAIEDEFDTAKAELITEFRVELSEVGC